MWEKNPRSPAQCHRDNLCNLTSISSKIQSQWFQQGQKGKEKHGKLIQRMKTGIYESVKHSQLSRQNSGVAVINNISAMNSLTRSSFVWGQMRSARSNPDPCSSNPNRPFSDLLTNRSHGPMVSKGVHQPILLSRSALISFSVVCPLLDAFGEERQIAWKHYIHQPN